MRKRWLIIITIICLSGMLTACQTHEETSAERIEKDVVFLCSDECNGRLPGSTGNKLAGDHIQKAFEEAGLVPLEGEDSFLVSYEQTIIDMEQQEQILDNIIGVLPNENGNAKDALLITAHFDHVGRYDDTISRGALDNASGVGLMLEVMRQLTAMGNTAKYDIVFAAFNGEDMNLQWSKYLSSRLPYSAVNVINFDCVGYKDETTLGAAGENKELQAAVISALSDGLSCVPYDDAPGSGLCSFEEQGIPAVTVSSYFGKIDIGSIIHQTADIPDILDFENIAAMVNPICRYALTGELIQPEPKEQEQIGPVEEGPLPFDQPMEMMFASGAGAWRTHLLLHPDGSFEGGYSNADMTIESVCSFHGQFRDITQVTDASWSLTLDELVLDTKYPIGQEWDDGMIHYISSDPYGFSKQDSEGDWVPLEPGAQFMFYTPDASGYRPTDELYGFNSDNTDYDSVMYQFWTWMPSSSKINAWDWDTRLGCYALCNMATGSGFFDLKAWGIA